jgi:AcrR family transcriptional regulator
VEGNYYMAYISLYTVINIIYNTSMNDRQKEHREEIRLKILNSAIKLFEEKGIEFVTMRKIAAEIKYTPTTIYLYYTNKEELLYEIANRKIDILTEELRRISNDNNRTFLISLIKTYFNFFVKNKKYFYLYSDITTGRLRIDDLKRNSLVNAPLYSFGRVFDSIVMQGAKNEDYTDSLYLLWSFMNGIVEIELNPAMEEMVDIDKITKQFAKFIINSYIVI